MELMTLKEFYQKNTSKSNDISLYCNYLKDVKKELKDSLEMAISLPLSDDIISDIQEQLTYVESVEKIIDNSFADMIKSSLDQLSDSEFNHLRNKYLDKYKEYQKKNEELANLICKKDEEYEDEKNKALENYYELGYKDSYYQAPDTKIFFDDNMTAREYLEYLISSELTREELADIFSDKYPTEKEELANMICNLRKIVKASNKEETLKAVSNIFATAKGIGKIIRLTDDKLCYQAIQDIQKSQKFKTQFFKDLPEPLRNVLIEENIDFNKTYNTLKEIYQDYLKNGKVTIPDTYVNSGLEEEIKKLKEEFDNMSVKAFSLRDTLKDRDKLTQYIVDEIRPSEKGETLSFKGIEEYLNTHEKNDQTQEKEKNEHINELNKRLSDLNSLCQDIDDELQDPNSQDFEHLNNLLFLNTAPDILNKNDEKEKIESKIWSFFGRMGRAIEELNEIKKEIESLNNIVFAIKKVKELKNSLYSKYQDTCQKWFKDIMDIEDIDFLFSGQLSNEKSERKGYQPNNFEELFNDRYVKEYIVPESEYNELRKYNAISLTMSYENLNKLLAERYSLCRVLLTIQRKEDGLYTFLIDDKEIKRLLEVQETIYRIYQNIHINLDSRISDIHNKVYKSDFTEQMYRILDGLHISWREISKESLRKYYQDLSKEMIDIEEELKEYKEETYKEPEESYDNIMSIEEAQKYYELLDGITEYTIPTEEASKLL